MPATDVPPALAKAGEVIASYTTAVADEGEKGFRISGKYVIPFPKGSDEFWFSLILMYSTPRQTNAEKEGVESIISAGHVNASQTPKEECQLHKDKLKEQGFDTDWIFNDAAPEPEVTVIQVGPSSNFLDRAIYTQTRVALWKLSEYATQHRLVNHISEVPQFLGYRLTLLGNTAAKCIRMQHKVDLRNTPANLLTIDKKSLDAPVDIHGKVFVVAQGRDLTKEELRELVIFCMGQAEAGELKLKSWDRLREALQEEARQFLKSAQHVRAHPALQQ